MRKSLICEDGIAQNYNELPYPSGVFPETAPELLYAHALSRGLNAESPSNARYLEIGCSDGSNLISIAGRFPNAVCVGLDLNAIQIAEGRMHAEYLGLSNIDLLPKSIKEPLEGTYDYIICHGMFSWVEDRVRTAILEACAKHLSPHGLAYISYNTYPGWHSLMGLRELFKLHTEHLTGVIDKVAHIRALAHVLGSGMHNQETSVYLSKFSQFPDSYIYHEMLCENTPFYLGNFLEMADAQDLQYLSDTQANGDQWADFVGNKKFRGTLLCHSNVTLSEARKPHPVYDYVLYVSNNPTAVRATRLQAMRLDWVSNQKQQMIRPDGLHLSLLAKLDGRNIDMILSEKYPGQPTKEMLLTALNTFASLALLIA